MGGVSVLPLNFHSRELVDTYANISQLKTDQITVHLPVLNTNAINVNP